MQLKHFLILVLIGVFVYRNQNALKQLISQFKDKISGSESLNTDTDREDQQKVGGYTKQPSVPNDDNFRVADELARKQHSSELAGARVVSV